MSHETALPLRHSISNRAWVLAFAMAPSIFLMSDVAHAQPAEVRIHQNGELSFGTFMVFGSGARSVSATGKVTDQSIVPLEGATSRPASFTVVYDRGSENAQALDVTLEVVISAPRRIRQEGVEARFANIETDLPGYLQVSPGEAIQIRMTNCRTRVCSRRVNLGGQLVITRHFGGASIAVPISLDATLISAERE